MSEPETLPAGVHPEIALLPWYASGTLTIQERQQVDRHLETCESCRLELQELAELKSDLAATYEAQPSPSSHLAQTVMAKVTAEQHPKEGRPLADTSWLTRLDHRFRSLFLPQWVPTLAVLLLILQMGLLLWVGLPWDKTGEVSTRSVDMQATRFAVSFEATTTAEQIRSLLQSVHGRVINGPSVEGLYTIEAPWIDTATAERTLSVLKGRTDVIRSAERLRP